MKPAVWIGILFAVAVIGAVAYSSMHGHGYRCRVCITYNGATDCRNAAAATREEAQRAATTAACAQLAGGVSDSIRCENTTPQSVEWK
jgi:hypothetical protein